jgi:hypothetical protein
MEEPRSWRESRYRRVNLHLELAFPVRLVLILKPGRVRDYEAEQKAAEKESGGILLFTFGFCSQMVLRG